MLTELQDLSERWHRAWLEKDAATVEHLMADDYVYVAPNGRVMDRQAILGIIRAPSYRLHSSSRTEVVVRPLGADAAVMRQRWRGDGTFEGTAFTEDHRCAVVCARGPGGWQVVMEQCTANVQ